jgi:hypothetical protein
MTDGRFFATYGDENAIDAFNMFLRSKTERMECYAANVTKTATGFHWEPYTVLESLKYCRKDVRCDAGKNTCNCYVTAKPTEAVYFDTTTQTAAMYQCTTFKYAFDTADKNLNYPAYMAVLRTLFAPVINHLHYSSMGVVTQTLNMDATAKANLANFINTFPDEIEGGYSAPWLARSVASTFGYNGKSTWSMSDLAVIDQSEKTCKWSTRP